MANTVAKYQKYAEYQDSGIEWLGEIPSHWFLKKHKYIAEFSKGKNPELLFDNYSDGLYPYLSMDSLRGKTDSKYAEYKKGLVLVQDNQPLIIWDGSNSGEFVLGRKGLLSSTMASACLIYEIQDKYYWYLCVCIEPEMRKHATGMGIPHVNGEELRGIVLPLPELNEQTQIANFLDHETAKIDSLIAKQEKLIELLKEKRQAVISHAVTKGLNPDVTMKDSGVEWLGEVPEHWDTAPLKYLCKLLKDGTHLPPARVDSGIPLLSVRNIINNKFTFRDDDSQISESSYTDLCKSFIPQNGDVLLAIVGATLGKVAVIEQMENFHIQRSLGIFRTKKTKLNNYFLAYLFSSKGFQSLLWENVGFSAQPGIYLGALSNFLIPVPSIEEQKNIIEFIKIQLDKFDNLINKALHSVQLMQDRRTALISAAVTGKIDVRHWHAPTVAEAQTELSA